MRMNERGRNFEWNGCLLGCGLELYIRYVRVKEIGMKRGWYSL